MALAPLLEGLDRPSTTQPLHSQAPPRRKEKCLRRLSGRPHVKAATGVSLPLPTQIKKEVEVGEDTCSLSL